MISDRCSFKIKREMRSETEKKSNNVICVMVVDTYKQKGPRVISVCYQALKDWADSKFYSKVKWESELDIHITKLVSKV